MSFSDDDGVVLKQAAQHQLHDFRLQTHRTGYRAYRYSRDGGATWDAMHSDPNRPCTRCQGSIISLAQRPNGTQQLQVQLLRGA